MAGEPFPGAPEPSPEKIAAYALASDGLSVTHEVNQEIIIILNSVFSLA